MVNTRGHCDLEFRVGRMSEVYRIGLEGIVAQLYRAANNHVYKEINK